MTTLRDLLAKYDQLTNWWAGLNDEANETEVPVLVSECERYSEGLESLAHDLVAWVKYNGMDHGPTLDWKVYGQEDRR